MIAMALALLAAAATPPEPVATDVPQCVSHALEEPALFTHRLVRCTQRLPVSRVLNGLSHQAERDAVTQRFRTILWRYVLQVRNRPYASTDAPLWLAEIERHAPAALQEDLVDALSQQQDGLIALTTRARAKPDAFGRLCAVAAVAQGSQDPVVEALVWDAWQAAPEFNVRRAMKSSNTLLKRLRMHLQALRATGRPARPADFDLLRRANIDWIWEELLAWSAVPDSDAARDATLAMAGGVLRSDVPHPYRERVRAALLRFANDSDAATRSTVLQEWAKLAPRKVSDGDRKVALTFAAADPVARNAVSPLLATFAADEPAVRPLLFAALGSREMGWSLAESIVKAPGVACWLPAELLPRLHALTDPEEDDWHRITGLATDLKNELWPPPDETVESPGTDGGGAGLVYCANYVGGPPDQALDAQVFGLESPEHDLLRPPSKPPSEADLKKWKEDHERRKAKRRIEKLAGRDRLVAFYAALPPLPPGYGCGEKKMPSPHVAQPPTGRAPQLVLRARFPGWTSNLTGWVLEAPNGSVVARAKPGVEAATIPSPWRNLPSLPVETQVEDWYRGPGTYILSFPDSDGPNRTPSAAFNVDAQDELISLELDAGSFARHNVTRQRPALAEVSVTLELEDERSIIRIVNNSPDVLRPAAASWNAAVRVSRMGKNVSGRWQEHDRSDDLPPGASMEIVVNERGRRTGDLVATVAFVPATDDLPDNVVWVARSAAVRRYWSQPKPIAARLPESCNPGFPPTLLRAVADEGVIAHTGTRLERLSPQGRATLLHSGAPLRGTTVDSTRLMTWTDANIQISRDGGQSFETLPLPDEGRLAGVMTLGEHITAFAWDGRAWRHDARAWHPLAVEHRPWFAVSAEGRLGAALDQCGNLFISSDAGDTWQMSALPEGLWHDLRIADQKVWLAGHTGLVASADAGASWDSWVSGKDCSGLAARGESLAVVCEGKLLQRLGEGIIDSGALFPPLYAHAAFDRDGELFFAFNGALFQMKEGWLLPLLGFDR